MNKIVLGSSIVILIGLIAFIQGKFTMKSEGMVLKSSAFTNEGMMDAKYTCQGEDLFPPLEWSGVPDTTQSFALIVDDPDAPMGTWVHWVACNIPGDLRSLDAQTIERNKSIIQGVTSNPRPGYHGPCPPSGIHRYYFTLYALDSMLDLDATTTKERLLDAMKNHIVAQAQLMGRYQKS